MGIIKLRLYLLKELLQLMGYESFWECLRDAACRDKVKEYIDYNISLIRQRLASHRDFIIKINKGFVSMGKYGDVYSMEFFFSESGVTFRMCVGTYRVGCVEL